MELIHNNQGQIVRKQAPRGGTRINKGDLRYFVVFQVQIDVLTDTCRRCGETQFTAPVFECKGHTFEKSWQMIADGEGKDVQAALLKAEPRTRKWLSKRGVEVKDGTNQ